MYFRSHKVVLLALSTIVIIVGIYTAINYLHPTADDDSNAMTYSSNTDVSFTFAPTLSIDLSTDSLTIDNLVPGTTSDSNSVRVTVSSNTPYGYVLSAGVGSTVSSDPYYNTSDLVHDNSTTQVPTANKFTSISTSASLSSLTTDNTWGYSTSTDGGTSWSTYSGLSHAETKPLLDVSNPATPSTIDFKIAARSASTQASGTYNNVITFYAVGKPRPLYMQETEAIKAKLKNVGDELQAIDQRDGKKYWVTKLADGNIWMTQNLDLCIGCEGTATLTSQNTDLTFSAVYGSLAYRNGYKEENGLITWTPAPRAVTSSTVIHGTTVSPAFGTGNAGYYTPYSAEGGDLYIYTSNSNSNDVVYDSLKACTDAIHSADVCAHYHIGNYYNWSAAIASNDSEVLSYGVASNSVCPAGWRLPKGGKGDETEFGELLQASGVISDITDVVYSEDGFDKLRAAPLFFTRGGYIDHLYGKSLDYRADKGAYWSSRPYDRFHAYMAYIDGSIRIISSWGNMYRGSGFSVRCVIR